MTPSEIRSLYVETRSCETCAGSGHVECWSPGGPCPSKGPCECCGPCGDCEVSE